MFLLLAGCGGCERQQATPETGSAPGAAKPAANAPQALAPGQAPAGAAQPGAPAAAGAPAADTAGGQPAAQDEDDCIVIADANPDYGPPPLAVAFSAEAECTRGDPTYKWDFGDGSASTEANPSHTYAKAGDFTATVTVTAGSANATDEIDVTVEEGEEPEGQ